LDKGSFCGIKYFCEDDEGDSAFVGDISNDNFVKFLNGFVDDLLRDILGEVFDDIWNGLIHSCGGLYLLHEEFFVEEVLFAWSLYGEVGCNVISTCERLCGGTLWSLVGDKDNFWMIDVESVGADDGSASIARLLDDSEDQVVVELDEVYIL